MASDLELYLGIDTSEFDKGLKAAEAGAIKAGESISSNFSGSILAGVGIASAALAGLFSSREIIDAALKQESAVNSLNAALRNSGNYSDQASRELQKFASSIQKVTVYGDEAVLEQLAFAQAMGATVEQSKEIVSAATKMSSAIGVDLHSAVRNITKTLSGMKGELGESVKEVRELTVEQLKAGDAISAVSKRFAGFDVAATQTTKGSLSLLKNSFNELLETIGLAITKSDIFKSAISGITGAVQGLISNFKVTELPINEQIKQTTDRITSLSTSIARAKNTTPGFFDSVFGSGAADLPRLRNELDGQIQKLRELKEQQAINESQEQLIQQNKVLRAEQDRGILEQQAVQFDAHVTAFQQYQTTIQGTFRSMSQGIQQWADQTRKQTASIGSTMASVFVGGVSNAFASFGAALVKGENAMGAFAKAMLGMIGDIAIQLGTSFIAQGIAHSLNPLTQGAGAGLIGAGAALVTVGGAIKALSGGGGGGGAGAGGGVPVGGVAGGGIATTPSDFATTPEEERVKPKTEVAVNVQGSIIGSEPEQLAVGIADLLNKAFDSQGVVVRGRA